jgi:hypothetical protein
LIFGDVILDGNNVFNLECSEGEAIAEVVFGQAKILYNIDCSLGKPGMIRVSNGRIEFTVNISYKILKSRENILIPASVNISFKDKDLRVHMEIKEMELPWDGATGIIPGENYERVEIR